MLNRLRCRLFGHPPDRRLRVIDRAENFVLTADTYEIRVLRQHFECLRCGRKL